MSKYLLVGDIQLQRSNKHKFEHLADIIESYQLPVVFLGDMLDKRGLIEADALNTLFNYLKRSKLHHYIIAGNHDQLAIDSTQTALEPLKALSNVWVIDIPTFIGKDILAVPFYRNPQKFLDAINYIKVPFILCHQGVKEFTLGSGYTEDDAVSLSDLNEFKVVVAGHYHTPHNKDNVIYLGSPYSHSFGESNEIKRIAVFDDVTGQLDYIDTDFPRHITVELDLNISDSLDLNDTNYNRVMLNGTREQVDKFDRSKYPNVKFITNIIEPGQIIKLKETQTPEQLYTTWFNEIKAESNASLYNLGLKVLKDVQ